MTDKKKMEIVWIQNLKALVEHGMFRDDPRWQKIFIEMLDETNAVLQSDKQEQDTAPKQKMRGAFAGDMDAPLDAIDRLRAFAGGSKDISFDPSDADEVLEMIEQAGKQLDEGGALLEAAEAEIQRLKAARETSKPLRVTDAENAEAGAKAVSALIDRLDAAAGQSFAVAIADMSPDNLLRLRAAIDAALPPSHHSLPADERVLELLKDPAAVLVNWLRGSINLDSVIERMRSEGTLPPSSQLVGTDRDDGIAFGIAMSVAFLIRDRDEPSIAREWWNAAGLTIEHCERVGLDEYDLAPIRASLAATATEGGR